MEIEFKNLGKIKEAKFDLSKNLTVFVGKNNTGKTYAAYGIYGFYKNLIDWRSTVYKTYADINAVEVIDLDSFTKNTISLYKSFLSEAKILPGTFGLNNKIIIENFTKEFILKEEFEQEIYNKVKEIELTQKFSLTESNENYNFRLIKNRKSFDYSLINLNNYKFQNNNDKDFIHSFVEDFIYRQIKNYLGINKIIFFPVERGGIELFIKQIFSNSFDKINDFISLSEKITNLSVENLEDLSSTFINRLPQTFLDFLEYVVKIDGTENQTNKEFINYGSFIEEQIANGKIIYEESTDEVYFVSDNSRIPFHLSSSLVKSLSSIIFYLRRDAQRNDIIIIDEPELNLHPDNQRKFARVLCQLANSGIKVIISTHSDYIISEINNMVALHHKTEDKRKEIADEFKIDVDSAIDGNTLGAYLFKDDGNVESLKVDEFGFSVKTIDDEINNMNMLWDRATLD